MKIDIQGFEHKIFLHADVFFKKVYVPYIFMEWVLLREYYGSEVTASEDKELTQWMVDYLTDQGYQPHSAISGKPLMPKYWYAWPEDVVWKHNLADWIL